MHIGNPSDWAERLRKLDVFVLQRLVALWPRCIAALPAYPDEDSITISIVNTISRDPEARRLFYLEFHYEPISYNVDGWVYSKGQIDMALVLDSKRDQYLAYECKRLNVIWKGKYSSLATRYVREGVARFVSEKYAAGLPVGCMLGYVMDGDITKARLALETAMNVHREAIALQWGPVDDKPVGTVERFSTGHVRKISGDHIEMRHALLAFGVGVIGAGTVNLRGPAKGV